MVEEILRGPRKRTKKRRLLMRALAIIIGAMLVAVGLEIFLVPNNIIDGGVTGLSIMMSHLTGLKLGLFLFILNLPFLVIGYNQIGKTFAISTLFGVAVMSVGTALLHDVPSLTEDLLLSAVFGGIIVGIGVGLVIRAGGSLDGTEIVAILLTKKSPFSVGEVVMFFNLFILGSAGFIFGWDRAMYSLIAYYIAYKMIDLTMVGLEQSRSVYIISEQPDEIGDALAAQLGRGITYLSGEGGYSGEAKKVIFCVITRLEEAKLKSIVEEIDSSAFLAIGHIHDVSGGRFKKKNIH
ncbi:membrane protein [Brevibacillus reuszeri]|uniref:Membrane protein n=1 Tax=Brevibacillus reuszeri TaxID=54915 RepID=A0A0K9YTM9_9BACL|nr:YitT family protein [Brevibacillus reuszeri]KNB72036.1 membrane protein [Brevibacillus reuszeri]MED1857330.1 YitT family protein [Brevibacillus reuszeri]GED66843.1 membrane protein [Brevibacillus reuszeri]